MSQLLSYLSRSCPCAKPTSPRVASPAPHSWASASSQNSSSFLRFHRASHRVPSFPVTEPLSVALLSSSSVLSTVVCTLSGCLSLSQISGKYQLWVQDDNKLQQPLHFPKTSTIANSCFSSLNPTPFPASLQDMFSKREQKRTSSWTFLLIGHNHFKVPALPLLRVICAHSLEKKKKKVHSP